jgi:hypothetical protein
MSDDPYHEPPAAAEPQAARRHNVELIVVGCVLTVVGLSLVTFLLVAILP